VKNAKKDFALVAGVNLELKEPKIAAVALKSIAMAVE
jgi:hypothetical protein